MKPNKALKKFLHVCPRNFVTTKLDKQQAETWSVKICRTNLTAMIKIDWKFIVEAKLGSFKVSLGRECVWRGYPSQTGT